MDRLAYPPAQSVATTVEQHFRRHIERTGLKSEVPDAPTIERIINAAFWASLRREEGRERTISPPCFVVEVIEPGLLVIKHRRAEPEGKFANVAVLEGDVIKIVDAEGTLSSECPDFVTMLLGFDPASC